MSDKTENESADPFAQMLSFWDDWTKTWSGAMSQVTGSKAFADTLAQQMQTTLTSAGLARKQAGEAMEQYLQQMNMPTRKEVLGLAQRLAAIEMRLDDLDAKLDQVLDAVRRPRSGSRSA